MARETSRRRSICSTYVWSTKYQFRSDCDFMLFAKCLFVYCFRSDLKRSFMFPVFSHAFSICSWNWQGGNIIKIYKFISETKTRLWTKKDTIEVDGKSDTFFWHIWGVFQLSTLMPKTLNRYLLSETKKSEKMIECRIVLLLLGVSFGSFLRFSFRISSHALLFIPF